MLRSGYTADEVLRETTARPLLEPIGPDAETALLAAGADARFIDRLKTAHPTLSTGEASAARAHQQLLDMRNDATRQLQASRLQQTAAPVAAAPNPRAGAEAARPAADPHYMANLLRDKLVVYESGSFRPPLSNPLENAKVIGLYCSAYVSASGRQFSPDLVKFYRAVRAKHPEFEIVAVSGDNSVFDMENMMNRQGMPWPALAFDQIKPTKLISQFIDRSGATRLAIVDGAGRLLANYLIQSKDPKIPLILPDLQKVIDDPTQPSTLAPPDLAPKAPAAP